MSESATIAMSAKARELRLQGKDIINLSIGEPDFSPPEFVLEAAREAIDGAYHSYTPVDGYAELREAICHKLKRDNHLTYTPDQIVVSTGAKHTIYNLINVLINPGDEVLLPAPYWVSYRDIVSLVGGVPVEMPTSIDTGFKITPQQLESAITDKTKVILYSSPCNPSGAVYSRSELEALADVLKNHPQVHIISDEIYEHITYDAPHCSIAEMPSVFEQTIVVNGLSKSFAMTGWRLGYMAGDKRIAAACKKIQGQITSGNNSIAQRAAITALEASPERISYMVKAFAERRKIVKKGLDDLPGLRTNMPEGAFYFFPDVSSYIGKTLRGFEIKSVDDFCLYLLENAEVATVTGRAFGNDDCIRMSYAASNEQLETALSRIKEALTT